METAPKEWHSLIPVRSISISVQTPSRTNKPKFSGPCHTWRQAAKWSAHIFQWEEQLENVGYHKFIDWEDFQGELKREFCPVYADSAAINRLESTAYFQKSHSVDEYLNEFQDLITEANYSDPKTIVVKFRRGLDTQIQNAIATMPSGRHSNMADWYTAARTIDQNRATNEAFRFSYQTPSVAPTPSHPATFNTVWFQALERSANHQHAPTPRNPVLMDMILVGKCSHFRSHCWHWVVFPPEKPIYRHVLWFLKGFSHGNTKGVSERKIWETPYVFLSCFP